MTENRSTPTSIGVITSGGDAQGMNPAVRAVVRTGLHHGIDMYAIHEGYQGLVKGGDLIQRMKPGDVDGILHRGGTAIGTARSQQFRTNDGRRAAAQNMVDRGIDALVVIGGDGSLTGANLFRQEWAGAARRAGLPPARSHRRSPRRHPFLRLVGLVGSIDNDMSGTDMTIGADTALHRIVEAMDALRSTGVQPPAHLRRRGDGPTLRVPRADGLPRHRGELGDDPRATTTRGLGTTNVPGHRGGRAIGRRQSVVIVAEGAQDRTGNPITARASGPSWRPNSARTPGSPSLDTSSAAARPARSIDTWRPCSGRPRLNDCSPMARTQPPN